MARTRAISEQSRGKKVLERKREVLIRQRRTKFLSEARGSYKSVEDKSNASKRS